jgi:hypothetical protein
MTSFALKAYHKDVLKNQTRLIEIESNVEYKIDRRTRGADVPASGPFETPKPVWVLILSNRKGEKRFVSEQRIWEFFRPIDSEQ